MRRIYFKSAAIFFLVFLISCNQKMVYTPEQEDLFSQAAKNGTLVNDGFNRCLRFVSGWLELADSATGLIPRNINDAKSRDIWNAKDCAADNYPFMVLTSALLDRDLLNGTMTDMLNTEIKLTSRLGSLPDTYSFSKKGFDNSDTLISEIIFGSAEYVKDGLIPLTEWLGKSAWSDRMISIVDDLWRNAPVETQYGKIVSDNPEVNGDMLQALSRVFWMTGDRKYLEYAERLGDYYLLGNNHPTRNFKVLRLRDHGCEIVSGLCELYATVSFADTARKEIYEKHIHEMLDRILEVGRNNDGLFYNSIDPLAGKPIDEHIADNFGYTLNGFYTVYLVDNIERYRDPVFKALGVLNTRYRNYAWEGTSSDGYADAIEGTLNLMARESIPSAGEWADSEIRVMWEKQQASGIIEGWHGDGNFARTTIMYCLWKTCGTYMFPWQKDLQIGAVRKDSLLYLTISSEDGWSGKLMFDRKRYADNLHLPFDWPRINQFPEYFTAEEGKNYTVLNGESRKQQIVSGSELLKGYDISIKKGSTLKLIISM